MLQGRFKNLPHGPALVPRQIENLPHGPGLTDDFATLPTRQTKPTPPRVASATRRCYHGNRLDSAALALPHTETHLMADKSTNTESDRQILTDAQSRGLFPTLGAFVKLSGARLWLQSAITLGGGSLASSLYLGILAGYSLMWLQPLAMILGIIMLSAIGYVTMSTGERPTPGDQRARQSPCSDGDGPWRWRRPISSGACHSTRWQTASSARICFPRFSATTKAH